MILLRCVSGGRDSEAGSLGSDAVALGHSLEGIVLRLGKIVGGSAKFGEVCGRQIGDGEVGLLDWAAESSMREDTMVAMVDLRDGGGAESAAATICHRPFASSPPEALRRLNNINIKLVFIAYFGF